MAYQHLGQHRPATHPHYYNSVMSHVMEPILDHYGGIEHRGAEVLTSIDGSGIITPKHNGQLETPALALAVLETTGDHLTFLGKPELGKPVLKQLIEYGDGIIIDRGEMLSTDDIEEITRREEEDGLFVIYVEGKRRPEQLITAKDVKRGAIALALHFGKPVIPVGTAGTNKHNRGPIRLVFGEPMEFGQVDGLFEDTKLLIRATKEPRQRLAAEISKVQAEAEAWSLRDARK
jgi:1-acyl-sn-glycerol-3-phosphate acyltransferase